ncbi:PilZ domain-containing protein [Erythrobacter sanguineus]|uniref:PilZ domain-containing protein n=1 Tax=Erythrobacter sanguineus TaxID=198312 RepID=UPI001FEA001A|nr:PilZ domain-containing protein [Erythrobacter sanguineus]
MADIRFEQDSEAHRVRVRNLSDGGMMAEGNLRAKRGHRVELELRNIGIVVGSVAWVQDNRFGIAFDNEIDSQKARRPLRAGEADSGTALKPSWAHRAPPPVEPSKLRKL